MLIKRRIQALFIAAFAIALPVAITLLTSPVSQAQGTGATNNSTNTLKVSPVRSDIQIVAGEKGTVPVTITNLTDAPISVAAITNDFVAGDDRGTPALILDADKFAPSHSLKRFMSPIPDVTLAAKQAKTINVTITVPNTAQAGGYFGAIRFAPTDASSGGQVNLNAGVASLILMTVPGDTVERLALNAFDVQQKGVNGAFFNTPNDLQASFSFENVGNLQLGPFGMISVKKGDNVVYQTTFNDQNPREMILPDSTRRWDVALSDIGEFGHYDVVATFTYGTKNQTIEVTKSFWVVPQWLVITAIAVLAVLVIAIILTIVLVIRRRKRRHMPRAVRRR